MLALVPAAFGVKVAFRVGATSKSPGVAVLEAVDVADGVALAVPVDVGVPVSVACAVAVGVTVSVPAPKISPKPPLAANINETEAIPRQRIKKPAPKINSQSGNRRCDWPTAPAVAEEAAEVAGAGGGVPAGDATMVAVTAAVATAAGGGIGAATGFCLDILFRSVTRPAAVA